MDYKTLRKIFFDCFKIDVPVDGSAQVLTVANDNSRSVLHAGKFYSPLIDTVEDDLASKGVRCISISRIASTIKGELSYGNVYAPDGGFARALLQKRLAGLFARDRYPYSRWEQGVWAKILDRTGAKKVVGIQPSRELCVACHDRGVWVADLQHGVISDEHPWYGEAFRGNEPRQYLPDAFLCWDEGSARVISKWACRSDITTRVIGHPWFARFANAKGDALVEELTRKYQQPISESNRPQILISLSWGERDIPNGFLADSLLGAIRRSAQDYSWFIRLHPNQMRGFARDESARFQDFFRQNLLGCAEWESATYAPLPVVLRRTDLHISWSSSVCIEASLMGIKSALLSPHLRQGGSASAYFSYQREKGMVDLVEPAEDEILAWIERNKSSRQAPEVFDNLRPSYGSLIDFLVERTS